MKRLRPSLLRWLPLLWLGLALPMIASAADELEVLEGFDELPAYAAPAEQPPIPTASPLRLGGWIKLGGSWNIAHQAPEAGETDWRGLSRLRPELLLEGDLRLPADWRLFAAVKGFYDFAYELNGRGDYSGDVLHDYEKELELREAYIAGPLAPAVDLKLGRQIVVWGRSDHIRVTDILNPLDQREPGLTDLEDLRLPVTMARLDLHSGPWTLTGLVIPEIRFDKQPPYGHDFYPSSQPLPPEQVPDDGLKHSEYAVALSGIFSGWDISCYGARGYDDQPHMELSQTGSPQLRHSRITLLGVAGSKALGNFLLFGEAAWRDGLEFFHASHSYTRTDLLLGVEYAGFHDTNISFEVAHQHLNGFSHRLALPPDEARRNLFQSVLRLSRTFWHERLTLTALAYSFNALGQDGALQRLQGEYELAAGLHITLGAVLFQSGDLPALQDIGANDRLFAELKWDF